mmetsp:Transcript_1977/g.7611  ORF Transcript_1977/g.7611 Transcript_1977/m.7611 type:complete len:386 (-) Transcript_1977:925-2082(-)
MFRNSCSNACVFPKSTFRSSAFILSSSSLIGALSGESSTTSKVQNGSAADAGRLIQSGSRPRNSCRFRDLLPTISPVNSGEGTACLPANLRRLIDTPRGGALMPLLIPLPPPAPETAPERLAAPPAMTSTLKSSALGLGVHRTACPAIFCISSSFPASNTVAKRHPSFLARTETCERISGISGVITPTTPWGMSSSPPTLDTINTVGTPNTLVWIPFKSSTTSTTPVAQTGEMMFHAPMCAISRSTGSSARSICDNGAAAVPRTISSEKISNTCPSTPSLPPISLAVACSAPMYRPLQSPKAFCTRSVIALACSAQSFPPRIAVATMPVHSLRQITSSSLPPVESARFSSARPVIFKTSTGALLDMPPIDPSTTCRTADSRARSR